MTQESMHGVVGTFTRVSNLANPARWNKQVFTTESRGDFENRIRAFVRFDDSCNNGHNSFAITGEIFVRGRMDSCGCLHDEIAARFPELAHLIKWHLTDSTGPMHYIANTVYHAGDIDHHGLRKGEKQQIRNGKTGLPVWRLEAVDESGNPLPYGVIGKTLDAESMPDNPAYSVKWTPWTRTGEGKERNLQAARDCAVWPDATDAQLCLPKEHLTELLKSRHAGLMAAFKNDIVATGLKWDCKS